MGLYIYINKASGNAATMLAHIELIIEPKKRTKPAVISIVNFCRFPMEFPTAPMQFSTVSKRQALPARLGKPNSGNPRDADRHTHEEIKKLETGGKLSDWCNDNLKWLKETFGDENLVAAVLCNHRSNCNRRTAESQKRIDNYEEKIQKKTANAVLLCARR